MATQQLSVDPEKLSRVSELQSRLRDKQAANETQRRQIANARQALKVSEEEETELKGELEGEMSELPDELATFIASTVTKTSLNGRRGRGGGVPTEEKLDWAASFIGDNEEMTLTELYAAFKDKYKGQTSVFLASMKESGRFVIKGTGRDRTVRVKKGRKAK
jgi:hypothetical protein